MTSIILSTETNSDLTRTVEFRHSDTGWGTTAWLRAPEHFTEMLVGVLDDTYPEDAWITNYDFSGSVKMSSLVGVTPENRLLIWQNMVRLTHLHR